MELRNAIYVYRRVLLERFLEALAVSMTVYELVYLIGEQFLSQHCALRWSIFCGIVIVACIYALWIVFWKKLSIELSINIRTTMSIRELNIMNQNGVRVIPVNEYFDTHLGDGIINPNSLHGQFLSRFKGREDELKTLLSSQLSQVESLPPNRQRTMVNGLPTLRYPLGTCIRIVDGEETFLLVAVTRFDKYEHVDVEAEEYPEIIRKLFNGIEHLQDGCPVYMPLVGSGLAGFQLTNMQMLNMIVQCACNCRHLSVTKGVTICLHGGAQMDDINLNVIKFLFNQWKTLK